MVTDYSKGKVYKITHDRLSDVYIGSTVNLLSKRMAVHRYTSTKKGSKFYDFVKGNGGWDGFKIILVETYPCNSKEELRSREEFWRVELGATLNERYCFGHDKERYAEQTKEYRQHPEVKERIAETRKEYLQRPDVKERIAEYKQRPEVKEKKREYNQRPDVKERSAEQARERHKRPEVKERIAKKCREYRQRLKVKKIVDEVK